MAKESNILVITNDEGSVIAAVKSVKQVNKAIKQYYEVTNDDEKIISISYEEKFSDIILVLSKDELDDEITKIFYLTDATYYK